MTVLYKASPTDKTAGEAKEGVIGDRWVDLT